MSKKIRLIYLLAPSHSGSTLLAMLLGSHPDICTVGELKATSLGDPEQYRCSCRSLIGECQFWQAISRAMKSRGFDFEVSAAGTDIRTGASPYVARLLQPLHRGVILEKIRDIALSLSPCWRKNFPVIQARNLAFIQSVSSVTGKNIIVDSSKIGIRLKYLLRIPEIEVRVVRVVRDGRGVALTYIDPCRFADAADPALKGGGAGTDREKEKLDMAAAAHEWKRSNEEAEAIVNRLRPDQWIQMHYEDLCRDPEKVLARLFRFIGCDPGTMILDFRSVEHHVVGNGMRLDSTSEIRLDERWKTELNERQLNIFQSIAGNMNSRFGYI
jgi:hypothetical protein